MVATLDDVPRNSGHGDTCASRHFDLLVGAAGVVGDLGWDYIGKLDPRPEGYNRLKKTGISLSTRGSCF